MVVELDLLLEEVVVEEVELLYCLNDEREDSGLLAPVENGPA